MRILKWKKGECTHRVLHQAHVQVQGLGDCQVLDQSAVDWPHRGRLWVLLGLRTTWVALMAAVMVAMVDAMTLWESAKEEGMLNLPLQRSLMPCTQAVAVTPAPIPPNCPWIVPWSSGKTVKSSKRHARYSP